MLQCMHASAFSQRSCLRLRTKTTVVSRCVHRVPANVTCNRRRLHCHAAAPSSPQPDTENDGDNVKVEDGPEVAPQSALERAKALVESEDVDKAELAAALNDVSSDLDFYRERLAAAEEQYQSLEGALATSKDQFIRLTADFENFRRRTKEEKERISTSVKGDVVLELLPLVDNFELARTQVKAETEGEQKINNSYQGLYRQMVDIIKSLGVEPVDTVGSPFDPEKHEAIMRQPNDDVPDGTVLMEFRKGFQMGERLLRPAMVQVSYSDSAPAAAAPAEGESKAE